MKKILLITTICTTALVNTIWVPSCKGDKTPAPKHTTSLTDLYGLVTGKKNELDTCKQQLAGTLTIFNQLQQEAIQLAFMHTTGMRAMECSSLQEYEKFIMLTQATNEIIARPLPTTLSESTEQLLECEFIYEQVNEWLQHIDDQEEDDLRFAKNLQELPDLLRNQLKILGDCYYHFDQQQKLATFIAKLCNRTSSNGLTTPPSSKFAEFIAKHEQEAAFKNKTDTIFGNKKVSKARKKHYKHLRANTQQAEELIKRAGACKSPIEIQELVTSQEFSHLLPSAYRALQKIALKEEIDLAVQKEIAQASKPQFKLSPFSKPTPASIANLILTRARGYKKEEIDTPLPPLSPPC